MKPAIPLTDPRFQWVPSHSTDIRKTFARVRAQLQEQAARERAGIVPIKRRNG